MALPDKGAGADFVKSHGPGHLGLMEASDIIDGEFEGLDHRPIEGVDCRIEIRFGRLDFVGAQRRAVKFPGEAGQGLVALFAHGFDDRLDPLDRVAEVGGIPDQQGAPLTVVEFCKFVKVDC